MKFSAKLTILFSVIVLISIVVISFFVYSSTSKIVEASINDTLKDMAVNSMDKIERMMYERYADIEYLATDPVISSKASTPAQITARLAQFRSKYRIYSSLSFFNLNRVRLADTSGVAIGKKHGAGGYWEDLEKSNDAVVMRIALSESLGEQIFHFASVVRDKNGAPFGVVVSRLPLNEIFKILDQTTVTHFPKEAIEIDLVDKDGFIIYSNHRSDGADKEKLYDWVFIKNSIDAGLPSGTIRHGGSHEDEISAFGYERGFADFKGNGWTLVLDLPAKVAFAPVIELRNYTAAIFAAIGLLSILIVVFMSLRITRPIKQLSELSVEIGKGNLDAVTALEVASRDEVGLLARSFNLMVDSLKESRSQLLSYSSGLESMVADRSKELSNANAKLQNELFERQMAEEDLRQMKNRLEEAVAMRTAELKYANDELSVRAKSLEERNREINLLGQMNNLHQVCNTVEEAALVVAKFAVQIFPDDSGEVYLINNSSNLLESVCGWGKSAEDKAGAFNPEDCWALRRGQPHIHRPHSSDLVCKHCAGADAAYICVPMIAHGETLGVFHVMSGSRETTQQPSGAAPEKTALALRVSEHIALSLSNLKLRETLRAMSIRDVLTGLFNRRYMEETLKREISRAHRKGTTIGIIMTDIDYFKQYNDTMGHDAGDALLAELGKFIHKNVRDSDVACRYGGEEFIIIMPEATLEAAVKRAEFLRENVRLLKTGAASGTAPGPVTLSFGIAVFEGRSVTLETVLKAADNALYKAKKTGRNCVVVADAPPPIADGAQT